MIALEKEATGCWTPRHRICSSRETTDEGGRVGKGIAPTQIDTKGNRER